VTRKDPKITEQTKAVLKVFLAAESQITGSYIIEKAELPSGTVYPILQRFVEAGWLGCSCEKANPKELGRPLYRFYHLTKYGSQKLKAIFPEQQ